MNPVTDPNLIARLNAKKQQPQQPPMAAPQQGQQPFNGLDPAKLMGIYAKAYPQEAQKLLGNMVTENVDPMQRLKMQRLQQLVSGGQGGGPEKPAGYVDEEGNLYTTPQAGAQAVTKAQLPYLARSKKALDVMGAPGTPRGKYYEARAGQAEIGALNQVEKAIDPGQTSRSTPIGAAASSVRRAINGLSLLQQPVVTKTALEATMGDLDSILTQASATVEGRRMLNTPNFLQNLTSYRSFVSASPDKVQVPPGMVSIYKNILQDLGPIAEKMIQQTVDQRARLYRNKAMQFTTSQDYNDLVQRVKDTYNIQKQLGPSQSSPQADPLGIR